jgi:hypothetical protein
VIRVDQNFVNFVARFQKKKCESRAGVPLDPVVTSPHFSQEIFQLANNLASLSTRNIDHGETREQLKDA